MQDFKFEKPLHEINDISKGGACNLIEALERNGFDQLGNGAERGRRDEDGPQRLAVLA